LPGAMMPEPIGSAAGPKTDDRPAARMGLLAYPRAVGAIVVSAAVETLAASLTSCRFRVVRLMRSTTYNGKRPRKLRPRTDGSGEHARPSCNFCYPARRTAFDRNVALMRRDRHPKMQEKRQSRARLVSHCRRVHARLDEIKISSPGNRSLTQGINRNYPLNLRGEMVFQYGSQEYPHPEGKR
jgi:hypothetical protein